LILLGFPKERIVEACGGIHREFYACAPEVDLVAGYWTYRSGYMVRIWRGYVQDPGEWLAGSFARGAPIVDEVCDSPLQIQAVIFNFLNQWRRTSE
jgi:hypothetical protein